ncbi:MAG: hypothetical protein U1F16_08240 [Turneriella sp.]
MHIARTPYESFRPGFWQTILYRFLVKLFHPWEYGEEGGARAAIL